MSQQAITAAEMKHYDSYTINTIGIPSLVLMERASLAVRNYILAHQFDLSNVVVVAGYGNNGGDGLCIARLLHIAGAKVSVIQVGNPDHASKENAVQEKICQYYEIPLNQPLTALDDATLVIDAIFGIGIDRPIEGEYVTAIEAINASSGRIVAVDIPSGINTDTGEVLGTAVKANDTVTFAFNKIGLTMKDGPLHAGNLFVADDMGTYQI